MDISRRQFLSARQRIGAWGLAATAVIRAAPADTDQYRLAWADEFDQEGPPQPANRSWERGFDRNDQLQWHQPPNAFCRSVHPVIEARREKIVTRDAIPRPQRWDRRRPHADYASGSVITRGRHE